MKDPGPNPVELLTAILAKTGAAPPSSPGPLALGSIPYPALFADDCSGAFNYQVSVSGDGAEAKYDPAAAFTGSHGILIRTRAAGATIGDWCAITAFLPDSPLPIIRFQLLLSRPTDTSPQTKTRILILQDDTLFSYNPKFEISHQTHRMSCRAKMNAVWTDPYIDDLFIQEDNRQWHHFNFTINKLTHEYGPFACNGRLYPLPALPLEPLATDGRVPRIQFEIRTEAGEALQANTHIDHVLITGEEAT